MGYNFYFILDTCEALKSQTGATNCKPDSEVKPLMNEFIITTKTGSKFFSEKSYIANNYQARSQFYTESFVLSRSLTMFNHFTID